MDIWTGQSLDEDWQIILRVCSSILFLLTFHFISHDSQDDWRSLNLDIDFDEQN